MDSNRRELLDHHKTIILPENIDYSAYELIAEAAILYPADPIRIFCAGAGGDCDYTLAITGIIQAHGDFTGLLAGDAVSSHAVLFAACQERYVCEHGRIGVHQTNYADLTAPLTANTLSKRMSDLVRYDWAYAEILSRAYSSTYWWAETIAAAPPIGFTYFDAKWLVEHAMAMPMLELKKREDN